MKKALIGIMVLACVALISGTALAATFWSVDVEGSIEFLILDETGLKLTGVGITGPITVADLTLTAGPWTADTSSITYTADMGTIGLALDAGQTIYDLGGVSGSEGVVVTADVAPLALGAIYSEAGVYYGIEGTYAADAVTLGVAYASNADYGAKLVLVVDPITATLTSGLGGAVTGKYSLAIEAALAAGTLELGYDDTGLLTAGVTGLPLTDTTSLDIGISSIGGATTLTGTATTALGGGVSLTTAVVSVGGVLTYENILEEMDMVLKKLDESRIRLTAKEEEVKSDELSDKFCKKTLVLANKNDLEGAEERFQMLKELYAESFPVVSVSAKGLKGLKELKKKIYEQLNIMRVYTKEPGKPADRSDPIVLRKGSILMDAARVIHKDFAYKLKYAKMWGSSKFGGQQVDRNHLLEDGDIVEFHL